MGKRATKYRITERVSGSFVGAHGRVRYALEPGTVTDQDVDPEVLARLIAAGKAVKASKPAKRKELA